MATSNKKKNKGLFDEILIFGDAIVLDKIVSKKSIEAPEIKGHLEGKAETAKMASKDVLGQDIESTYVKGVEVDGTKVTFTKGDDTPKTVNIVDNNKLDKSERLNIDYDESSKVFKFSYGYNKEDSQLTEETNK